MASTRPPAPVLRAKVESIQTPILIVDDLADNRDLLQELLNDEGYESVLQAESGMAALKILASRADIGLVLLDVMMPEMDGYQACRLIHEDPRTAHIPIIVITGGALRRDDALLKSFECGAMDFLPKPVNEVELHGRVLSALELYEERMTSRRKTQAVLESQQRYELAVSGVNDGIWDINFLTKEVFFSTKWKQILGYEDHEIPNRMGTWETMIHPEDKDRVLATIKEHWDTKSSFYTTEHRLKTKSGEYKWVFSRGRAIWDEQGNVIRMAGSTTDITLRKNLEVQLRQAQQMESIGRLAAGVAHDFNNLLTAILGQASLGKIRLPQDSPVQTQFDRIEKAALQAADFCKQMLAYAGQGCYTIEQLNLNQILKETADLIGISISKKISLRFNLVPKPLIVEADTAQLRQVILNLLLNGAEAIGDQPGSITIHSESVVAADVDMTEAVLAPQNPAGQYVLLEVTDTGSGMSVQTREKIFEPFFTTKFTGRGLGLSAVLGIIKAHEGALKVISEVGRGTTFRMMLPQVDQSVAPVPVLAVDDSWRGSGTILLVEDEPGVREISGMLIEELGFDVLSAEDGVQGVETYKANASRIIAVVMDLNMPNLNGEEAFQQIRAFNPASKVLLASGYTEQEALRKFTGKGLAGFLQKPFRMNDLRARLRNCLAGSSLAPTE